MEPGSSRGRCPLRADRLVGALVVGSLASGPAWASEPGVVATFVGVAGLLVGVAMIAWAGWPPQKPPN